jgi:hypothetical protein
MVEVVGLVLSVELVQRSTRQFVRQSKYALL